MAQTVYVVYHEDCIGDVTYHTIDSITLTEDEAKEYCDVVYTEEYNFYVPMEIDMDISALDHIYVVIERDNSHKAFNIVTVKSIHASQEAAEKVKCENEIIVMKNSDGVFC